MTFAHLPSRPFHSLRPNLRMRQCARLLTVGVIAVGLSQLAGCAAQLWPPSSWSLSVDLPFLDRQPVTDTAPIPNATPVPTRPKDLGTAAEALAYAEALCALSPDALDAEIERLQAMASQDGHSALHEQQLAFAQRLALRLASLRAEQQRLQEFNDQQAQLLRERQQRIEQLNGQIAAMRAVEDSLPQATPLPSSKAPIGPGPANPPSPHTDPDKAGSTP
ncbi:hypothetical protein ACLBKS_06490 [Hylemonella sp. W303a]|uniref:hypothetical protein n=1 Tax=Hylemonella sp. W303a TaxID=3389873 RepID=UPI00396B13BF